MTQAQTIGPKERMHRYLKAARDALLWKLDGLDEYDIRRPLTPTGTNLLGLVKHVGGVSAEYFGSVFDRPFPEPMPWFDDDAGDNAHMWATAEESRADIAGFYQRVWVHADATIEALDLDAPGVVPWWGENSAVTLHQVMVHLVAEINRHAGHADIVRELIDGTAGLNQRTTNMPDHDEAWWADYRARVEQAAKEASGRA